MQGPTKHQILLATSSKGKIDQYKEVLETLYAKGTYRPFTIHTLTPKMLQRLGGNPPEENGGSTMENAVIKAEYYARLTGMITISDDSAFCVDALGGAPGLMSHRLGWNPEEVLKRLYKSGNKYRRAHYITSVVACIPEPDMECYEIVGDTRVLHGKVTDPVWVDGRPEVHVSRRAKPYGYDGIFIPNRALDSFDRTVDTWLRMGQTRLGLGYPRAMAFYSVFTRVINQVCPF